MGLTTYPSSGVVTPTSAVNKLLSIAPFSGSSDALFLDNKSIAGRIIYPWSTLAGEPGLPGTNTGGGFGIVNDSALTAVTFDALTSLSGSIKLYEDPSLTTLSLPLLASLEGRLSLSANDSLTALLLPALQSCAGALEIYQHAAMTEIDLSALASCAGSLQIFNTALTSLDLSAVQSIGAMNVGVNDALTSLDLSALTTINPGGLVQIFNNPALVALDLSRLTTIHGQLSLPANAITSVSLGALQTLTGSFSVNGDGAVVSVDLSGLTQIPAGAQVQLRSCGALTSVSISSIVSIAGGLEVSSCGFITSVTVAASIALSNDFLISFADSALDNATVDAILAACAAGMGGTNSGTLDLSGGSNATPTGGTSNSDYLTLSGAGITVNINS